MSLSADRYRQRHRRCRRGGCRQETGTHQAGIDDPAGDRATRCAEGNEIPLFQAEGQPGLRGEEVGFEEFEIAFAALDVSVAIDQLHVAARFAFEAAKLTPILFFEFAGRFPCRGIFRDVLDFLIRQGGLDHFGNDPGGVLALATALFDERLDGGVQRLPPFLPELPETTQEFDLLVEGRLEDIDHADDPKELPERVLPGLDKAGLADRIDDGHARLTGPAKDFHFRFILGAIGGGAIDDVDDAGAIDDRLEEFAFVVEAFLGGMLADEPCNNRRARRRAGFGVFHPVEGGAGALKAGRIHQRINGPAIDPHRKLAGRPGGARFGSNVDREVARER